uniref:Transmembrane protein n=1 Tax=Bionectria ochroleuca TaxID=29856 RepID=A0A8H7K4L9_BIOOC
MTSIGNQLSGSLISGNSCETVRFRVFGGRSLPLQLAPLATLFLPFRLPTPRPSWWKYLLCAELSLNFVRQVIYLQLGQRLSAPSKSEAMGLKRVLVAVAIALSLVTTALAAVAANPGWDISMPMNGFSFKQVAKAPSLVPDKPTSKVSRLRRVKGADEERSAASSSGALLSKHGRDWASPTQTSLQLGDSLLNMPSNASGTTRPSG